MARPDLGLTADPPGYLRITPWGGTGSSPVDVPPLPKEWPPKKRFVACKDLSTGALTYGTVEEIALQLDIQAPTVRSRISRRLIAGGHILFWVDRETFIKHTGRLYRNVDTQ